MKSTARFSVDPRLSALLGESYTSSERALRELVDNAWDAEAKLVKITLPDILSNQPVVIEDDGHGMKNQEIRQEYLKIASPRFSRKGERTPNLENGVSVQILTEFTSVLSLQHATEPAYGISRRLLSRDGAWQPT